MVRVNTLRRTSQIIFFFLIVYVGVIGIETLGLVFLEAEADSSEQANALVSFGQGKTDILNTYGPVKTCRYVAGDARLFNGCALYYFSKTLTTFASLNFAFVLPHVLLFFGLAFIFGRLYCGWMCPLGFLEEIIVFIRKKIGYQHVKLPESIRVNMAMIRYAFITIIFLVSFAIAIPSLGLFAYQKELYILGCQICPARVILPILGGIQPVLYSDDTPIISFMSIIGIIFLGLYLSGFIFRRPWCRICPSGAMLGLFNSGSMLTKEKDVRKCTKCGICARTCVMDNQKVWLEKKEKNVSSSNCVRCFKCIENCPEPDCLTLKIFGKVIFRSASKMKTKKRSRKSRNQ